MKNAFLILLMTTGNIMITGLDAKAQDSADNISGIWTNETGERKLEFYKTTKGTYEAKVAWFKHANSNMKTGDVVIKDLKYNKGSYTGGKAYDPNNGGWISCTAMMKDIKTLDITGSKGWFSRTKTWKR